MQLELFGAQDEPLGPLDCDEALLGSFPISDGCRIHVSHLCHLGTGQGDTGGHWGQGTAG
uniref:Ubiquitin-like domain-containing protein n=1 Tax=Cyanistes caeruleus TaxID=156563 RepID=A0A8C0VEU4_CYACU